MSAELKPCPFCGSVRVDFVTGHVINTPGKLFYKVYCKKCQCRTQEFYHKGIAFNAWNASALSAEPAIKTPSPQ